MKLLINQGRHEILTPAVEIHDQIRRMEKAGRTAYQTELGPITQSTAAKFINKILHQLHHESVIEHSYMTVKFFGTSRGFTHEMVRHRLASYTQMSTRYVDFAKEGDDIVDLDRFQLKCVPPPHRDVHKEMEVGQVGRIFIGEVTPAQMFEIVEAFYRTLRKNDWVPGDARQILPIGTVNDIVVSANLREWRHIFKMRTTRPAHWEIRRIMGNLLEEVQGLIPVIFDDFYEAGKDKNGLRYFKQRFSLPKEIKSVLYNLAKLVDTADREYNVSKSYQDWEDSAAEALQVLQEIDSGTYDTLVLGQEPQAQEA